MYKIIFKLDSGKTKEKQFDNLKDYTNYFNKILFSQNELVSLPLFKIEKIEGYVEKNGYWVLERDHTIGDNSVSTEINDILLEKEKKKEEELLEEINNAPNPQNIPKKNLIVNDFLHLNHDDLKEVIAEYAYNRGVSINDMNITLARNKFGGYNEKEVGLDIDLFINKTQDKTN